MSRELIAAGREMCRVLLGLSLERILLRAQFPGNSCSGLQKALLVQNS